MLPVRFPTRTIGFLFDGFEFRDAPLWVPIRCVGAKFAQKEIAEPTYVYYGTDQPDGLPNRNPGQELLSPDDSVKIAPF